MARPPTAQLVHRASGRVLAGRLEIARSFFARGRGLMFRAPLEAGQALMIEPCSGIHMLFVRFPIDAVFLDQYGRVLRTYRGLKPWTGIVPLVAGARSVVELAAGELQGIDLKAGEELVVEGAGQP
jgi:uncharacterized membrane protein (UPF0127 family)